MKTDVHSCSYLPQFFLDWEFFQTKVVEKINTFLSSIYSVFKTPPPPPPENRAVYEIMRKNVVEPDRSRMTIWRKRVSYGIPKATNTHSEYVILTAFSLQLWLHKLAWVLHYTYITCLVGIWESRWISAIWEWNEFDSRNEWLGLTCLRCSAHT
jgi:hypothetical protein